MWTKVPIKVKLEYRVELDLQGPAKKKKVAHLALFTLSVFLLLSRMLCCVLTNVFLSTLVSLCAVLWVNYLLTDPKLPG